MSSIAVRNIQRPGTDLVAALARYGVATLHEAQGRIGLMDTAIRPIYAGAALCGPALTVLTHPGDNWMLHVAAELLKPGDIVVIACSSPNGDGMFGELLATSYKARGAKGLVSDTGVRDVKAISALGFPVFSRHVSAKGTVKATVGSVNVPVVCAGMLVNPGDVVAADDDGVVVIPRDKAAEVARAAQAREDKEAATRQRLAAGELGLDLYGMREALAKAGLKYVD
ncbi:MAG: 4-carboxy-4-hydroxy-2-oxoadipate aldolase/oxaloacetate decarboxylase [Betaproteobacteria bacterium RIFCSPLOWO2_02_FULL_67_19]|nr:MAG: 4-carboxy-4-hydroxy-2-oxoadipate aldolase/oxaloacetate decarboxylase [Betaproteobacteria bacterium RIFCSPLOWO2_02_FULL_67_19]